jgi:HAD superfamily phosphoserine phosphatase-like hydrolase
MMLLKIWMLKYGGTMIIASDLEGTLTTGATWKGLEDYLKQEGHGLSYNLFFASRMLTYLGVKLKLVELQRFKNRWLADLIRLYFKGQTVDQFDRVADWVAEHELWPKRRPDVVAELQSHAAQGHQVVITSGVFTPIVRAFAQRAGINGVLATALEVVDGRLTGRVDGLPNAGPQKAANLITYLDGQPLLAAYGDTLADVPMLERSQTPVAVYPDTDLRPIAESRGWRIIG